MDKVLTKEKGVEERSPLEPRSQLHGGLISQPNCEAFHPHSRERALGINKNSTTELYKTIVFIFLNLFPRGRKTEGRVQV